MMKEWRLVVLLCTALLCEPVWSQEKWSRPDTAEKRIDDWVPITARLNQKNLEPNDAASIDEIGSLLNPPAAPTGRAFNFNAKQQNNFNRAPPTGEPYEITTPPALSGQFFSQKQVPKIPQPVHFPVPFFGQQNPFQSRFQGFPPANFQPQFTFIPQAQIQSQPKENKVIFPESPFIQQQNKAAVQLVYVPIEALQRQKPRLQADRPVSQQTQLDVKAQSPFETGKLKFQRPPQPFDPPRFPTGQQFEQEPNRFAPPPTSFEQNAGGRFPPPSQLFEQAKPTFPSQLKEQRPEFSPQNEQQPVAPQSYMFLEDARNPPSNFFQFHENRFQKPSFEGAKPVESNQQVQQSFATNFDENRQESAQNFVSSFDENRPRQEPPQNVQQNFQETKPRQEERPQNVQQNFQETRPRQEERPQNVQQNFQETRPRQEIQSPPQFVPTFEQPKLELQQPFIPNFQETKPRPEPSQPPQFVPKFEEPKLEPQQQFIPNFQDIPQQEEAQQTFSPNFEPLRPKPEAPQNFVPRFQETRPKQEPQGTFLPTFEEVNQKPKPNVQLSAPSSTPTSQQQTFNLPSSTEQIVKTTTPYPPPHQPPLSVYMEKRLDNKINEVLTILKDAKTIPVLDTIGNRAPKVFVGPSDLDAPRGYVKFELPYLSSLDITKIDSMVDRLPFFVAPLNFKPPSGYAKIPFPPPHIGSVVVSSKSPGIVTSTEFVPFTLTSQLPTEVNSLQPSVSSTTQRGTDRAEQSTANVTPTTPKRSRQRKPLHRGSLTSFSTSTLINDVAERQNDQFTTPAELQRLPENSPSSVINDQQQFVQSTTPTPARPKFSRKPAIEQQQPTVQFETTQAPVQQNVQQQQQQFDDSPQQHQFTKFSRKPAVEQQQPTVQVETTQAPVQQNVQQQQQFDDSPQQHQFTKFSRKPAAVEQQQTVQFESTHAPVQQNPQQQQFDHSQQQQFIADQQVPHLTQQDYLNTLPQLTQPQLFNNRQPSDGHQQQFIETHQQFLDNRPQIVGEQNIPNNAQSLADTNNSPETNRQQFISSSTEKQIFKNFQQIQPLSQYQVGNNFLNQQQSSTERVQSAAAVSNTPQQTVSYEPAETETTVAPTETPKLRQRLSYYDKLLLSSTQPPPQAEIASVQNPVETSEKPRERPKLRARHRLTTTRKPATESSTSEELPEQVSESITQRYNPLKRRRPIITTTTTEQTETTRASLRSRTTQANRSEFVRSRSRRPTTTTTSTTTTTEAARVQHEEDGNNVHAQAGQDEQKKIEEAASFWNEPVTIQQSHGYELEDTARYTQAPSVGGSNGKFSSGEPPEEHDFSKEKYGGNEKKAHDPNSEKKGPGGRRGHWVRVRVKKPQDNLDTAESQNSLGPLTVNAVQETATKPTTTAEFPDTKSTSESAVTTTTAEPTTMTPTPITTSTTTTTTTFVTASQPQMTTTAFDYNVHEGVTEEQDAAATEAAAAAAETTTVMPAPSSSSPESSSSRSAAVDGYPPDDEQDEAFQRNLADMLAKFIGGGNEPQQTAATTAGDAEEESTAETQYAASDAELTTTVAPPAVTTELPAAQVTSTTTKVSMETEICYRGRCVKSKKNKQITDLVVPVSHE